MSRPLTLRNTKKAASSVLTNQKYIYSEVRKSSTTVAVGSKLPQYRLCSLFVCYSRVNTPSRALILRENVCRSNLSRNISSISARIPVVHHTQVAWRRFLQKHPYNEQKSSPIVKITQAVTLALSHSHYAVPGIFAFMCGQVAWAQNTPTDTNRFPSSNTLYMRAQDGHAHMTTLLFSVIEGVILLFRAIYLTILFSPSVVMAPFADSFGPEYRKLWLRVVHHTLERAGPAFIKWGQWAATRPDLFPKDLCGKLSELHTKAPEHSFAYTKKTIEKAFGRKISEIF